MHKRLNEEQIVGILREAETGERTISEVCRAHGIAQNTFQRWRQKYGGLQVPKVRRLRDFLNREWFHNVREARVLAESFRRYYNQERPHPPKGHPA